MSIYFQLFFSFVKIGFTSFGGLSMVPLILEEMEAHAWMTSRDMSNLIAIAEMTPGPLGMNCATFAGQQTAGFVGGLFAVAGVLTPAFTLAIAAAVFFEKFHNNKYLSTILSVIKPICLAMIVVTILKLSRDNYFIDGQISILSCAIGSLMLFLILKRKWTVPKVILTSAFLGIISSFIL